jgi:hypothetical protein
VGIAPAFPYLPVPESFELAFAHSSIPLFELRRSGLPLRAESSGLPDIPAFSVLRV